MIQSKIGIDDIAHLIRNARVLIRTDYNVPVRDGVITDPNRIYATLPTLRKVLDLGPKSVTIISHRGRPNGKRDFKYSLHPVVPVLEGALGRKVTFIGDCVGSEVENACLNARDSILLLENLRFRPEEQGSYKDNNGVKIRCDPDAMFDFRKSLSRLGDVYINDAFGTAHRPDSSISGVYIPVKAAGLLLKKEIDYFGKALQNPERPFLVMMGGAKLRDKIPLIMNMLDRVDEMILGGGISYTFLKRLRNMEIGNSLFDPHGYELVPEIMKKAEEKGVKIHLPDDIICAPSADGSEIKTVTIEEGIPAGWEAFDEGNLTKQKYQDIMLGCKTIIWNGPLSFFENPKFRNISYGVLDSMIKATEEGAITIAGGGDTGALIRTMPGAEGKVSHVSTGGGASLELLEGKKLPGIEFLTNKEDLERITM